MTSAIQGGNFQNRGARSSDTESAEYRLPRPIFLDGELRSSARRMFAPISHNSNLTIENLKEFQRLISSQKQTSGSRLSSSVSQELLTPADALALYLQEQASFHMPAGSCDTTEKKEENPPANVAAVEKNPKKSSPPQSENSSLFSMEE